MVEQLKLLAAAVCFAEDSVVITSSNLEFPGPEIVFVNRAFTRMTGYRSEDALGQTPRILQGEKTDRAALERMKADLKAGRVFYGEAINYRKDGTEFVNEWHIEPIYNDRKQITHYVAIQRDITGRKQEEARLIYEARHDSLTGLYNRAHFMTQLQNAVERAKHSQDYLFAVLFIDLDHFKLINDSFGHQAGDQLLTAVGQRLQNSIRPQDLAARWGGDEFAVLLDNIEDLSQVSQLTEEIRKQVQQPILLGHPNPEVLTTLSIGIALSSMGYESHEDLLRDADTAMYRAKSQGQGRHAIFTRTMHEQVRRRLQIETDLRYALKREELRLHYQPIVCLQTRRIVGAEALVRWQHPTRGFISPSQFIPVAEETGLISALGEWVLRQACLEVRQWRALAPASAPFVSVNLATQQLNHPQIVETVRGLLETTGCPPEAVKFELTESAIASDAEIAVTTLKQIKDLGIQLCIDDFGTGHSSLSRLSRFPIDTLKIDRSFIQGIGASDNRSKIAQAIVNLAQTLEMTTIAEGIETPEQLSQLRRWGCDRAQGFWLAKPVPAETFKQFLIKNSTLPTQ
ncbi:EAL domain-containing protein [Lyngbya sp. CCY1209]|uniref:putative bifunctional diguanylate cyclase/phosphodiesterase n=1 Tax=Lyngbya sp. CCY1209 TaxID=2886103 RepID=UPI002D206564|nr:EAL domain-containing protein [Lyngbya sp. CCY1209]MEB3887179.1 EAL domain-containing protein [Lyngbya sp. CCY1209]